MKVRELAALLAKVDQEIEVGYGNLGLSGDWATPIKEGYVFPTTDGRQVLYLDPGEKHPDGIEIEEPDTAGWKDVEAWEEQHRIK